MNEQSSSQAFLAFAEAFETGFATRDWAVVDRLMTDDVVWSLAEMPPPVGGTQQRGRRSKSDKRPWPTSARTPKLRAS